MLIILNTIKWKRVQWQRNLPSLAWRVTRQEGEIMKACEAKFRQLIKSSALVILTACVTRFTTNWNAFTLHYWSKQPSFCQRTRVVCICQVRKIIVIRCNVQIMFSCAKDMRMRMLADKDITCRSCALYCTSMNSMHQRKSRFFAKFYIETTPRAFTI